MFNPKYSGDKHVSEIASMAFDLLAGFVVLQIPHRPNMKLNVRMGFHRKVFGHKWQKYLTWMGKYHSLCAVARRSEWWRAPSCRATASCPRRSPWPGGSRASARAWGSTSARSENMVKQLLPSNISLIGQQTAAGQGRRLQVWLPRHPGAGGEFVICEKFQYFSLILFCSVSRMRNWTHFGW